MKKYDYLKPTTLQQALSLLEAYQGKAKIVAGGTDVMVWMKTKWGVPEALISLKHIPELNHISENGSFRIGSATTLASIQKHPALREAFPVLIDAVNNIGSVQIRNVGTMGGNICNAAPSADTGVALLTLGAAVKIAGTKGERTVALEDFFVGPNQTILTPEEIVSEFILPRPQPHTGGAYWKHTRRKALQLPLVGIGVTLSFEEDLLTCKEVKIALGVAAPTPMRAREAEHVLRGKPVDEARLMEAGETAAKESRVRDTVRCSAWYRREMIRVYVKRMGMLAWERAQQEK